MPVRHRPYKPRGVAAQRKWDKLQSGNTAVAPQYLTPDSVDIPQWTPVQKSGAVDPEALALDTQRRLALARAAVAPPASRVLDGFLLLNACQAEFPDEGHSADITGVGANAVADEDLVFFTRLASLDAGENALTLAPLGALPRLKKLRLPCNGMRFEAVSGDLRRLAHLQTLDVSYNALDAGAVECLVALPSLTELDLTCNALIDLPPPGVMCNLENLERLVLERNKLDASGAVWHALSCVPNLRELQLGYNSFNGVSEDACEAGAFPSLQTLGLAYNEVAYEEALYALVQLPKLEQLSLYGNPLLGPTGEDATGEPVARLAQAAAEARDGWTERPLEILTEVPRGRGQGERRAPASAGPRSHYRDLDMASVTDEPLPTAAQFRAAGTTLTLSKHGPRRAKKRPDPLATPWAARPGPARAAEPDTTFLTGMGGDGDDDDEDTASGYGHDDARTLLGANLLGQSMEPNRNADPAKLRAAMQALRFALKHPLTSHHQGPAGVEQRDAMAPFAERGTAASRARQLPRRQFEMKATSRPRGVAVDSSGEALAEMERALDDLNARTAALAHLPAEGTGRVGNNLEGVIGMANEVGKLLGGGGAVVARRGY